VGNVRMLNDGLVDKAEGIGSSGRGWDVGSRRELKDELAIGGGKRLREEGLLLLLLLLLFLGSDFLETSFSVDLSLGGGDSVGWLRGTSGKKIPWGRRCCVGRRRLRSKRTEQSYRGRAWQCTHTVRFAAERRGDEKHTVHSHPE
jgi:hypothetical protein